MSRIVKSIHPEVVARTAKRCRERGIVIPTYAQMRDPQLIPKSITARMNAPEFRRVLRNDGRLLIAIPAPDDLIELRGAGRDRVPRTIETFAQRFTLVDQRRATSTSDLDAAAVEDVLHSIYRPLQPQAAKATRVTFSLDLLLFRPV